MNITRSFIAAAAILTVAASTAHAATPTFSVDAPSTISKSSWTATPDATIDPRSRF